MIARTVRRVGSILLLCLRAGCRPAQARHTKRSERRIRGAKSGVEPVDLLRSREFVSVEIKLGGVRGTHFNQSRFVALTQDLEDLGESLVSFPERKLAPDLGTVVS